MFLALHSVKPKGIFMKGPKIKILIAERNPNMRDFLRRELAMQNFLVEGAKNSDELFAALSEEPRPDLLVLAINTINTGSVDLLERVTLEFPDVPVILHAYLADLNGNPTLEKVQGMVEKSGNPEKLKRTIMHVLGRRLPDLMEDREAQENGNA